MNHDPKAVDFEALRAERNKSFDAFVEQMRSEGFEVASLCAYQGKDACYCACPEGPCEHKWDGENWTSEDGYAQSVTCSRCGTTAMSHSLRTGP